MRLATLLLAMGLICSSCGTTIARHYDGPQRPPGELAFIEFKGDRGVYIESFDGQKPRNTRGPLKRIECLPGPHSILLRSFTSYATPGGGSVMQVTTVKGPVLRLEFEAVAGGRYVVEPDGEVFRIRRF